MMPFNGAADLVVSVEDQDLADFQVVAGEKKPAVDIQEHQIYEVLFIINILFIDDYHTIEL